MGFEIWWDKNSGRSIQPNSNLKTACRYAYNDALMENEAKIKELEDKLTKCQEIAMGIGIKYNEQQDKLKIAVDALGTIRIDGEWPETEYACKALEKIGELK